MGVCVGAEQRNVYQAFGCGLVIGCLGGLIGLGGTEFRLPLLAGILLISAFKL